MKLISVPDNFDIIQLWRRYIQGDSFTEITNDDHRTTLLSKLNRNLHQINRLPTPPETPENHWHEVTQERLRHIASIPASFRLDLGRKPRSTHKLPAT